VGGWQPSTSTAYRRRPHKVSVAGIVVAVGRVADRVGRRSFARCVGSGSGGGSCMSGGLLYRRRLSGILAGQCLGWRSVLWGSCDFDRGPRGVWENLGESWEGS
jgi:hypothetical protein